MLRACGPHETILSMFDRNVLMRDVDAFSLLRRATTHVHENRDDYRDTYVSDDALKFLACSVLVSDQLSNRLDEFDQSLFYKVEPIYAAMHLIAWLTDGTGYKSSFSNSVEINVCV